MPVTRLMSIIGIVAAALVTLAFPASYYAISAAGARQALRIETTRTAHGVEEIVRGNPEMWEYQSMRLLELLSEPTISGDPNERIVRDVSGKVVVRTEYRCPAPAIATTVPLYDAGETVGSVEGRRPLGPILTGAALMALAGFLIGLSVYIVFRTYPIRMLDKALSDLSKEKRVSEATLQAIGDGVLTVDASGKVALINPVAERLLGWPSEAAIGKPLDDIYDVREEGAGGGERAEARTILRSEDGVERIIEEVRSPVPEAAGGGHVIAFRDITDRLRAEEELVRIRQLESIGLLAAGLAQDFDATLGAVAENIARARADGGGAAAAEKLDAAERAAARARELTRRLLAFSGTRKSLRKVVNLEGIVGDGARSAVRGSPVRCYCEAQEGLWNVEADPEQVAQVVGNIVLNAAQAIGGRGTVRIRLENRRILDGQVPHVRTGRYVAVEIRDSGPGIRQELLPRVLQPYVTTKENAMGLGLAVCYTIMKSHGGNILADSAPGRGATFTLYFPATDRPAGNRAEPLEPSSTAP